MKIDKEDILKSLDIRAFYKSLISSLKDTGKNQPQISFRNWNDVAFLVSKGHTVDEITIDHEERPVFHFPQSKLLEQDLKEYDAGISDYFLPAFLDAIRSLRRRANGLNQKNKKDGEHGISQGQK